VASQCAQSARENETCAAVVIGEYHQGDGSVANVLSRVRQPQVVQPQVRLEALTELGRERKHVPGQPTLAVRMAQRLRPNKPIRRFDVFAEYRMLDAREDGMKVDQAKGYGLWVAKVVAARKFGRLKDRERQVSPDEEKRRRRRKWRILSGVRQTDKLFDHEIVERMGREFYLDAFAPAVREARERGQTYEEIRDRIRRRWRVKTE
jgi:hypothetical protein